MLLVKVNLQQIWAQPKGPVPYPAWVVVDPQNHWAVVSYDRQDDTGGYRGTIEYQKQITDIAFPLKITEQVYDLHGTVEYKTVRDFTPPQPCKLPAKDFTLEAFGLEPPQN